MNTDLQGCTVIPDIRHLIESIQPDSIISRTVYSDELAKVVLFGFGAGPSLYEHTAAQPAVIQILDGQAVITLADSTVEAGIGTWIQMPPHTRHSVEAKTPLVMLLTLFKA